MSASESGSGEVSASRLHWLALIALSVLVTAVLEWARLPAAMLLGPTVAAMLLAIRGVRLALPRGVLPAAQAVIGCLIARSITPSILASLVHDWVTVVVMVASSIAAGALVGWVMVKRSSLPGMTAAWGFAPGAASVMVAMAGEYGADVQLVAFIQYLRLVIVIFSTSLVSRLLLGLSPEQVLPPPADFFALAPLPFVETLGIAAVGAVLGPALKIPSGGFMLTMALGIPLYTTGLVDITLPPWLLIAAYAILGWFVGLGFTRKVFLYAVAAIPQVLLGIALLIALSGLSAWLLVAMIGTDPVTAYLATSPGGADAMAIIAITAHADVSLVMVIQTLRLLVLVVTGPYVARLICRYA